MNPLALVFYPTSSELLVNRLLDPRAPTSPDPDALHDCKMRSSWLRSNFKSFVNHYKQDPQRFKNILLEMNYMCMACSPFDRPYPTTQRVDQQAEQRLAAKRAEQRLLEEQRAEQRLMQKKVVAFVSRLWKIVPTTPLAFRQAIRVGDWVLPTDRKNRNGDLALILVVADVQIEMEMGQHNGGAISGWVKFSQCKDSPLKKEDFTDRFTSDEIPTLRFKKAHERKVGSLDVCWEGAAAFLQGTALLDLIELDLFLASLSKWMHVLYLGPDDWPEADQYFANNGL